MKFTRRVSYVNTTYIGESKINESLEIEDKFELEEGDSSNFMDTTTDVAQKLIQEIKKEVPCVDLESSSTE